jgi:hypothetical protein
MSSTVPLFPAGIPGGPELLVLLVIFLVGAGFFLVLPVLAYFFGKSRGRAEAERQQ